MAKRWKVIPYDGNGEIIQRGVTSVEEGVEQVQLIGKLAHAFHRCAKGSVKRIVVHDAAEGVIRQWEAGVDNPLPEPEPPEKKDKPEPPAAKKPAGKVAKGKTKVLVNAKVVKARGTGVLATIGEMITAKGGASIDEIVAQLEKRFPERRSEGMRTTAKVQVKRQGAEKREDSKRGTVWYK